MAPEPTTAATFDIPRFDRRFFDGTERFTVIGGGAVGGKAAGLLRSHGILTERFQAGEFPDFAVSIPTLTVLSTELFDAFMERNHLWEVGLSERSDDFIANCFQKASLPVELVGDLRALVEKVRQPLAVRSSSLLEDALYRPFAGVYKTKMIPNNQFDTDTRFRKLVEAVKFVYASVFTRAAKNYIRTTRQRSEEEKMAVILQEVVGRRHRDRFYPDISGVARSYSYYRSGGARPEDGVVNLALGLGKTIVDGGLAWSYSPAHSQATPPFASPAEALSATQSEFWAVNMGKPPAYDPTRETEYLLQAGLPEAEADGTLPGLASTYDPASDRLVPGVRGRGPRVLNFAPILVYDALPLNDLIRRIMSLCEEALGEKVEIEFAVTLGAGEERHRFGLLQMRPLVTAHEFVEVTDAELRAPDLLLASDAVMGNGWVEGVRDVVYVRPDRFDSAQTRAIAREIAQLNDPLLTDQRPYLLIGFGRWGSADPWLGIPVEWGHICGARAIVEATLPNMNVELSQGTHFFHNISSCGVSYFCVRHDGGWRVDWDWLARQEIAAETERVLHVRLRAPLVIQVDGRTGKGVIRTGEQP